MSEAGARPPSGARGRRRIALLAVVLVAVAVGVFMLVRGCGGSAGPADRAAQLVPEGALVYVHLATDPGADQWRTAGRLAARFPSYPSLRDTVLGTLGGGRGDFEFERDVRPWLGDEAAFALLAGSQSTAGSVILLAVTDEAQARSFLERRAGKPQRSSYRGTRLETYRDGVVTAFKDGFLVVGQPDSVRASLDVASGRGTPLEEGGPFKRAADGLPQDGIAFLYASSDGVKRLLAPQGGVPGLAGTLVDSPDLVAAAAAVEAEPAGFRLTVQRALTGDRPGAPGRQFKPTLAATVPGDALAYLGTTNLDRTAQTLLASVAGAGGAGFRRVFDTIKQNLQRQTGVNFDTDVLPLLRGESAVFVLPRLPSPVGTIAIHEDDPLKASSTLQRLQPALARILTPAGRRPAVWKPIEVAGTRCFSLRLNATVTLIYGFVGDRLVIATGPDGIRAVRENKSPLTSQPGYRAALGSIPDRVSSVVFLNLAQLLTLGGRTGLAQNPAFLALRGDLQQVAAVGAVTTGGGDRTRVELFFNIP